MTIPLKINQIVRPKRGRFAFRTARVVRIIPSETHPDMVLYQVEFEDLLEDGYPVTNIYTLKDLNHYERGIISQKSRSKRGRKPKYA